MSDPTKVLAITGALMTATSGAHLCNMLLSLGVVCMPNADGNVWWPESQCVIVRSERGWAMEYDLGRTSRAVEATAQTLANWCQQPIPAPKCVAQACDLDLDAMAAFLRLHTVQVTVYPDSKRIECQHTRWTLTPSGWVITFAPWFTLQHALMLEGIRMSPSADSF